MRKEMIRPVVAWSLALALAVPGVVLGQQVFIYPDRGQTPEQQSRDKFDCYSWAVQQTGFDPSAPQVARAAPSAPPPMPGPPEGGLFRGAGRGAALGAVGGAIGGDAGKGAAIGAAVGGLFGAMRRAEYAQREEYAMAQYQHETQAAAAQQSAALANGRANYNRAYGACLSGRGYTVR